MTILLRAGRAAANFLGRDSWLVRRLRPSYESLLGWSTAGQKISVKIPWPVVAHTRLVPSAVMTRSFAPDVQDWTACAAHSESQLIQHCKSKAHHARPRGGRAASF